MKHLLATGVILALFAGCFSAVPKRDDLVMLPVRAAPKMPPPETQPAATELSASKPSTEAPFLAVPLDLDTENLTPPTMESSSE